MTDISKLKLGDIVRFKTKNNAIATAIFNFRFYDTHTKCETINFLFIDYEDYGYMKCALDDAVFCEFRVSSILNIELATEFEINKFYDKLIAQYEKEDPDIYTYFSDSTYYELKDWLTHKCQLFVDDNFKYPSFVDNFADYAWEIVCKKSNNLDNADVVNLVNQSNLVSLDKVEEFLESCLFNNCVITEDGKEVPYEIVVIKYKGVSELIDDLRKAVK